MNQDKTNLERVQRIVYIITFIFLIIAIIVNHQLEEDPKNLIPHGKIVSISVHFFCAVISFIIIFRNYFFLQMILIYVESTFTIIYGYEQLGIFLFYGGVTLILIRGLFLKRTRIFLTVITILHFASLFSLLYYSWARTFLALGTSVFYYAFYSLIYTMLKGKLSCFIPSNVTENKVLANKLPGTVLKLSDYGLSERQIDFIFSYMHQQRNYNEISQIFRVSLSTVKKEFASIFKIFDVSKMEELYILLMQYQLVK